MQLQVKKSKDQIKSLEDNLRAKNQEYEKFKREIIQAQNREEGVLKALGSTIKDTIDKISFNDW